DDDTLELCALEPVAAPPAPPEPPEPADPPAPVDAAVLAPLPAAVEEDVEPPCPSPLPGRRSGAEPWAQATKRGVTHSAAARRANRGDLMMPTPEEPRVEGRRLRALLSPHRVSNGA